MILPLLLLSSHLPLKLLWVKPGTEETLYQKNQWFKHRPSLELQEVVCLDDGILFLRWRLAGVVLSGEWFSIITRDGGREEQATGSFSSPFCGVLVYKPKANLPMTWQKNPKTKESKVYDLVFPSPQEGIKARHRDQSWASEWLRREDLCGQVLLHQAGWGFHPPHTF